MIKVASSTVPRRAFSLSLVVRNNDASSDSWKYRPNLAFRKAKTSGKAVETVLNSKVPVPRLRGEPLFGIYPVLEALAASRREMFALYVKDSVRQRASIDDRIVEILTLTKELKIPIKRLTGKQLDKLTEFQLHNGVLLDCSPLAFSPLSPFSLCVFMDGVLDPGNVGAIARSLLFFGGDMIVYAKNRGPSSITHSMSKASAGALERMKVARVESFTEFADYCSSQNAFLVGTSDPDSARKFNKKLEHVHDLQIDRDRPIAIVMGDEGVGISGEVASACDILVSIPPASSVPGHRVSSLNVSVAAGILLNSCRRL